MDSVQSRGKEELESHYQPLHPIKKIPFSHHLCSAKHLQEGLERWTVPEENRKNVAEDGGQCDQRRFQLTPEMHKSLTF